MLRYRKTMDLDIDKLFDYEKTYDDGCFNLPAFGKDISNSYF